LGYIYGLEFPLNIDSVNHAYLIKSILISSNLAQLPYYHYAFHCIIAALNILTGIGIPKIILFFGQLLQIIAPIAMFFPVHRITNNKKAALISVFVAGLGWSMPSESTSWGKYPALMAMSCTIFIFYIANSFLKRKNYKIGQLIFVTMVLITGIFIHSRIIILLIIGLLATKFHPWRLEERKNKIRYILISSCLITILTTLIFRISLLDLAFSPYSDIPVLLAIFFLLLPFGISNYPENTFKSAIFVSITIILLFAPSLKVLQSFYTETLIDEPFLSIFMFMPLSISFGTSFDGLERFLLKRFRHPGIINLFIVIFVSSFVVAPNQKVLKPLVNANLVTTNDLLIYQEIRKNLPSDARILIPNDPPSWILGLDGGAWIEFVTGRQTIKINRNVNLTSDLTLWQICSLGAQYLYIGSNPYSFSTDEVSLRQYWYTPLYLHPDAKLYQIVGCP
jgi:hypothetical protein